jgi:hypothetical protein
MGRINRRVGAIAVPQEWRDARVTQLLDWEKVEEKRIDRSEPNPPADA